jgi:hypothetical protein
MSAVIKNDSNFVVANTGITIFLVFSSLMWGMALWFGLPVLLDSALPSPTFIQLFGFVTLLFVSVLSSCLAILGSTKIDVQGEQLEVRKYFGLLHRNYSSEDILDLKFIPEKKSSWYRNAGPRITVQFKDRVTLNINSLSSNFPRLWKYLGGDLTKLKVETLEDRAIRKKKGKIFFILLIACVLLSLSLGRGHPNLVFLLFCLLAGVMFLIEQKIKAKA